MVWGVSLDLPHTQFELNFAYRQLDTSTQAVEGLGLILVHHPMTYITEHG